MPLENGLVWEIIHKKTSRTSLTHVFKVNVKVKVIETNMSICVMRKSTVMRRLNAIA